MLTDEDLAEIEKRCEAATIGPWTWRADGIVNKYIDEDAIIIDSSECANVRSQNCVFIAASRSDVPRLVAEVRSCRAGLLSATEVVERLREELALLREVAETADGFKERCRECVNDYEYAPDDNFEAWDITLRRRIAAWREWEKA